MRGPGVVCAGCSEPTTLNKPVCDRCLMGIAPGASFCTLCNSSLYGNARILPTDKWGCHYTATGGYAGKCTAVPQTQPQTEKNDG